LPYVLYHHERWDGTGYPTGRAGEQIPVEARVLAVADAFDAMTSDRPYRPALSRDDALAEVERCSGSQFDPELSDAFIKLIDVYRHEMRNRGQDSLLPK
jgi:HD-GYP domain-containing protein (c-di-GMP phosphodiesterase class II)